MNSDQGRIIHEAGEAEASGPGSRYDPALTVMHLGWQLRSKVRLVKETFKPAFEQLEYFILTSFTGALCCNTIPCYGFFSANLYSSSRLSHDMGWLRILSINCITSQVWKLGNFAILSVLGRRLDTPTAMRRCVEWTCQITS